MTNYIYMATSLDGFIAASDDDLDWLDKIPNPDESDFGYADFISGIDAIVMGRRTFEKVRGFDIWPYKKPVYVLSQHEIDLSEDLESKVKLIAGTPKQIVDQMEKAGHQNLYIDGGITIQGFLEDDLIDEMIITRVPILLGDGIPLFGMLTKRLNFEHMKTEVLNDMLVKSHYRRIRK